MIQEWRCRHYQLSVQEFVAFIVRCFQIVGVCEPGLYIYHFGPPFQKRGECARLARYCSVPSIAQKC